MAIPDLETGDLVFFSDGSWLSRAIGWFTRSKGESATKATHIGYVLEEIDAWHAVCYATAAWNKVTGDDTVSLPPRESFKGPYICEALWTVKIQPLPPRLVTGHRELWRCNDINQGGRLHLAGKAGDYYGRRYGWWKNAAQAGDGLLGKLFGGRPYIFRRLCRMDEYPICSWLVAHAFAECSVGPHLVQRGGRHIEESEYYFGIEPNAASPDDIHDCCVKTQPRFGMLWSRE